MQFAAMNEREHGRTANTIDSDPRSGPVIHIIDDDESLVRALARTMQLSGWTAVCYPDVARYLMTDPAGPGCVVLDVCLPGPSGLELYERLLDCESRHPVIFLTGVGDIDLCVEAMRSGASDFLSKPVDADRLLEAVRHALMRDAEQRAQRELAARIRRRFESLSASERTIFHRLTSGRSSKLVAAELGLGLRTVGFRRARLMRKMHATSVADLVRMALVLEADAIECARRHEHRRAWQAGKRDRVWAFANSSLRDQECRSP